MCDNIHPCHPFFLSPFTSPQQEQNSVPPRTRASHGSYRIRNKSVGLQKWSWTESHIVRKATKHQRGSCSLCAPESDGEIGSCKSSEPLPETWGDKTRVHIRWKAYPNRNFEMTTICTVFKWAASFMGVNENRTIYKSQPQYLLRLSYS